MKRLLQVRMLFVLLALALIPAATLPFAARLRDEWTKFWEPELEADVIEELVDHDILFEPPLLPAVAIELMEEAPPMTGDLTVPVDPRPELPDA